MQCAYRADSNETNVNLSMSAFSALANLVQFSAPDVRQFLNETLSEVYTYFSKTLENDFEPVKRRNEFQGYLASLLQVLLLKLEISNPEVC